MNLYGSLPEEFKLLALGKGSCAEDLKICWVGFFYAANVLMIVELLYRLFQAP